MTKRSAIWTMLGLLLTAETCPAQFWPWGAGDNKPVACPFQLTEQQQTELDAVLDAWKQQSAKTKTFECKFVRWDFDRVFGPADQARYEDLGQINYASAGRYMFRVDQTKVDGQWKPSEEQGRGEYWICDGKATYERNFRQNKVFEHKLPPEAQGKDSARSFFFGGSTLLLFGASPEAIEQQYFLRLATPPDLEKTQIWLEAYPRFRARLPEILGGQDPKATLILTADQMQPYALRLESSNGSSQTVYRFYDVVVNNGFGGGQDDPFAVKTPPGWAFVPDVPTDSGEPP